MNDCCGRQKMTDDLNGIKIIQEEWKPTGMFQFIELPHAMREMK